MLRTPGLARLGRGPLALVDVLGHAVHYDQTHTAQAFAGSGLASPALADYLPQLVRYVLDVSRRPAPPAEALAAEVDAADDPLDEG